MVISNSPSYSQCHLFRLLPSLQRLTSVLKSMHNPTASPPKVHMIRRNLSPFAKQEPFHPERTAEHDTKRASGATAITNSTDTEGRVKHLNGPILSVSDLRRGILTWLEFKYSFKDRHRPWGSTLEGEPRRLLETRLGN